MMTLARAGMTLATAQAVLANRDDWSELNRMRAAVVVAHWARIRRNQRIKAQAK